MKRVSAYCRVSTDKDDQINSLESQKRYFEDYITRNPDWELINIYVDEGKTGTSTKKRKAFNQMIVDGESRKFDLILTKEISRFARNTLDSIFYTRKLKDLGIGVIFMNDNINTLDPDSELRLTIMSSIAQEESRKTSDRVKWGQKRRMEQGVVFGNTILGYTIEGGKLYINPNEAETVELIFHKYLYESKGLPSIAKELEQSGILTSYKNSRWNATAVLRILSNEKYCGDLKQRKFYTPSYLTHTTKKNKGEEEFVMIQNNHDPIIPRDIFDRTQAEITRRSNMETDKTRYTNRYAFSGKLQCGLCGASFISRTRNRNNGNGQIQRWQCSHYFKYGHKHTTDTGETLGCENTMVRNEILEHVCQLALRDAISNKDSIIAECVKLLSSILNADQIKADHTDTLNELNRIVKRKDSLIDLCVDGYITKEDLKSKSASIDQRTAALQEKLKQLDNNVSLLNERDALLAKIKDRITQIVYVDTFSEDTTKEIIDKVVIHGKNQYDVYFKGIGNNFF